MSLLRDMINFEHRPMKLNMKKLLLLPELTKQKPPPSFFACMEESMQKAGDLMLMIAALETYTS